MSDDKKEKDLWKKFKDFYLSVPFGSWPKANIDAFVYELLEEEGFFAGCKTPQDIAYKLKITPAKARNLMLNSALLKGEINVEECTKDKKC